MLGQYKKIATGGKTTINISTGIVKKVPVNINLAFKPSIIFCSIWRANKECLGTIDSRYTIHGSYILNTPYVQASFTKDTTISEKGFNLTLYSSDTSDFEITWIAIE